MCGVNPKRPPDIKADPHPDGSLVAEHTVDGQPGGQVQQALEDLLIQLQVGELALPLQRTQVDLVRGQVLRKPAERRGAE